MYVWGHGFEFTCEEDWQMMEKFLQMVTAKNDTWYATNIEVVDYLDAAKRLQYTAAADAVYNPSAQSVWIEVDGRHIEVPGGQLVKL